MRISIKGAIDTHVHSNPELFDRIGTALEIAQQAAAAGMSGIVFKTHNENTLERCEHIRQSISGFRAMGGVTLNHWAGGFDIHTVQDALSQGAKIIWMPTLDAAYHNKIFGGSGFGIKSMTAEDGDAKGLTVWGEGGALSVQVDKIMSLIQQAKGVLATSHLSPEEIEAVVLRAKDIGLKVLVNHVYFLPRKIDISYLKRLTDLGAILELCAYGCCPIATFQGSDMSLELTKNLITAVGPENCILATDSGQVYNPWPHETLRTFAQTLHEVGIPERDLRMMMVDNPSKLLNL